MSRRTLLSGMLLAALCVPVALARASNCAGTSTGRVPLNDLGSGLCQGFEGGLYAGGSNQRPPAHAAAGLAIAHSIAPLDTFGNPDPDGRIVLISIGMSNATQEFSAFVPKAMGNPAQHPRLLAIDCAKGGQATQDIRRPTATYWDTVYTRLRGRGSSPLQAQAVWLKEARRTPTEPFPASAESLLNDLGTIVRIIKDKLPNVRLLYLTSRIYAGYATTALNPEPYAYESGFAVKWLIGAQIAGEDSLNYDRGAGAVEAPWLAWGPYLWADGLSPRSDGLTWRCEDFTTDGTHPSASGRDIVSDSLLAFFERDETTAPWFVNPNVSAPEPARGSGLEIALAPNPARGAVAIGFRAPAGETWRLEILDPSGRRVRELGRSTGFGARVELHWDGHVSSGGMIRAGVYWVRLSSAGRQASRRFVMLTSD